MLVGFAQPHQAPFQPCGLLARSDGDISTRITLSLSLSFDGERAFSAILGRDARELTMHHDVGWTVTHCSYTVVNI